MNELARAVYSLHEELISSYPGNYTVSDVIQIQAKRLHAAHNARDKRCTIQLSNWLPACIGKSVTEILQYQLEPEEALLCIAKEHGFETAESALSVHSEFQPDFELALNFMVNGEIDQLKHLLEATPRLVKTKSPYGHGATLLLYMAANGVETWRQNTPANAPEILQLLLNKGAIPSATAWVYGGHYDTLALLMTSSHPAHAGVQDEMAIILQNALQNWKD